jgi:GNAT superfamily N-acetyltransferase
MVSTSNDVSDKPRSDPKKMTYSKISDFSDKWTLDCTENGEDKEGVQDFIENYALTDQKSRLSCTYLAYYEATLVGYFTVSPTTISWDVVKDKVQTRDEIRRYPAILISNLAVDKKRRGRNIGSILLNRCIGLSDVIAEIVGARYVMLYTYTKEEFYSKTNRTPFKFTNIRTEKDGRKLMVLPLVRESQITT